jgi:hypothetical protein
MMGKLYFPLLEVLTVDEKYMEPELGVQRKFEQSELFLLIL